ncbi:hypothetical protein Lrub_1551 [Legionella rubrilucens]|uniref:Uncharacterized protein n=2 Tax=Legionella rubrilucens TaxID=458 RepID=A0A0W0XPW8_9GAMM|nr:hypothetical protein [Legionella rubrilucens]KTD46629.1 hypothetical protein Lrub_1551 [Legionella rubrilucens]
MRNALTRMNFSHVNERHLACQVKQLPQNILTCLPGTDGSRRLELCEPLAKNMYEIILHPLKHHDHSPLPPQNHFDYTPINQLTIAPKHQATGSPLNLTLYHIRSQQFPNMHYYFLITPEQTVAAHAHFNVLDQSECLACAYGTESVIVLNAIESRMQGDYSLGTILIQAIFEQSQILGCEGRICLYSARKSGRFYFKLGFMPLQQTIFDQLFLENQQDIDGDLMFLSPSAIDAWAERARQRPLLGPRKKPGS